MKEYKNLLSGRPIYKKRSWHIYLCSVETVPRKPVQGHMYEEKTPALCPYSDNPKLRIMQPSVGQNTPLKVVSKILSYN